MRFLLVVTNMLLVLAVAGSTKFLDAMVKATAPAPAVASIPAAAPAAAPVVPIKAPSVAPMPPDKLILSTELVSAYHARNRVQRFYERAKPAPANSKPAPAGKGLTVSNAPALRPLPKFVQSLSDSDFKAWASWQNEQARLRKSENHDYRNLPDNRMSRTIVDSDGPMMRGNYANRRGSFNRMNEGRIVIESGSVRYFNPDYVGPGPLVQFNPFVKYEGGTGEPDWSNLFVPCENGTMTVTEAINKLRGPMPAEELFTKLMTPYFKGR